MFLPHLPSGAKNVFGIGVSESPEVRVLFLGIAIRAIFRSIVPMSERYNSSSERFESRISPKMLHTLRALMITTHAEIKYEREFLRTERNFYFTDQIQLIKSKSTIVVKERSFFF